MMTLLKTWVADLPSSIRFSSTLFICLCRFIYQQRLFAISSCVLLLRDTFKTTSLTTSRYFRLIAMAIFGEHVSLVHIETILSQLPEHTVAKPSRTYEHLDILWGKNVHEDVIPEVLNTSKHSPTPSL